MKIVAALLLIAACGRYGFDAVDGDGGSTIDAPHLGAMCPAPPVVPTTPTIVVGNGQASSCTEAALRNALTTGGVIGFNCGAAQATISLTSELVISSDTVLLGGGGTVVLSGGNTTRVMRVPFPGYAVTLYEMVIISGATAGNGAGVLVENGSLTVIGSLFNGNTGPVADANAAGGAIAMLSTAGPLAIYSSYFMNNKSANGGAIRVPGNATIVDSQFLNNAATGVGGQTMTGGLGGAIMAVGTADNVICGTRFSGNTAGDSGGTYFRVSTTGAGSDRILRTSFESSMAVSGGGAYIQDIGLELKQVSFALNTVSNTTAGLWVQSPADTIDAENLSIVENRADSGLGAGLRLAVAGGSIRFSTIASNVANCAACFAAAIEGGTGVELRSTIVANNMAAGTGTPVSCRLTLTDGGGNVQWPNEPGALCAVGANVADPMLQTGTLVNGPSGSFYSRAPSQSGPAVGVAPSALLSISTATRGRVRARPVQSSRSACCPKCPARGQNPTPSRAPDLRRLVASSGRPARGQKTTPCAGRCRGAAASAMHPPRDRAEDPR